MAIRILLPLLLFAILWFQGATLGLSDDEAYYWVLAQNPALSYAFHPPAVAWMISFFQFLFQGWLGHHSVTLVRLPAAFSSACILFLALRWMNCRSWLQGLLVLSFFSFFALSWMIVPDIPLFLGWTALFVSVWSVITNKVTGFDCVLLVFGAACVMLAKYSGILAIASALLALWFWAPKRRWPIALVLLGLSLAWVPILIWNAQHEWGSILYQIRDRHGRDWSGWRFLKFWIMQLLLAGPVILWTFGQWTAAFVRLQQLSRIRKFTLLWALPPAVIYGLEPLLSDFKPHWALIAWWPILLTLAFEQQGARLALAMRMQLWGGLSVACVVLGLCHMPIFLSNSGSNSGDIKSNVTNDLYGWSELEAAVKRELSLEEQMLPWVGSRYQTAGQVAFSLGRRDVTFLPRSLKELDEWPNLQVTDTQGPEWPVLLKPILFATDNRYDAPPAFQKSSCSRRLRVEGQRAHQVIKWIDVWKCVPTGSIS